MLGKYGNLWRNSEVAIDGLEYDVGRERTRVLSFIEVAITDLQSLRCQVVEGEPINSHGVLQLVPRLEHAAGRYGAVVGLLERQRKVKKS